MRHKAIKIAGGIATLLVLAALALPWKEWIGDRLKAALAARGFADVQLTVSHVGLRGITLSDITLGGEPPLALRDVTVAYSLSGLLQGNLRELELAGLALEARQQEGKWSLVGMRTGEKPKAFVVPVTPQAIADIPLDRFKVKDSSLHVDSDAFRATLPLQLTWQKLPEPKLEYKAPTIHIDMSRITLDSGDATLTASASASKQRWEGTWEIKDIAVKNAPLPVPPLQATGTVSATAGRIGFAGRLASKDEAYKAGFDIAYALADPAQSQAVIEYASLPWSGGVLSVKKVGIPIGVERPVRFDLSVRHVSLDTLMQMLTGDRASASGSVSGTVPITVSGGAIAFQAGKLQADQAGTITVPADAIPGDNKQIALLRDILGDFHYKLLAMEANTGADKRLAVVLRLEGNNPGVYNGRPVRLNVQFNGDMLGLLEQSILPMTDPGKLLKQGDHDQK